MQLVDYIVIILLVSSILLIKSINYGLIPFILISILYFSLINNETKVIFILMFIPLPVSIISYYFDLNFIGITFVLIGIGLALDYLNKNYCYKLNWGFGRLLILLGIFLIWYLLGPKNNYSIQKISFIFYYAIISFFCFLVYFQSNRIQYIRLSILLISNIAIIFTFMKLYYNWPGFQNIKDLDSIRNIFESVPSEGQLVNYHQIGYLGLFSTYFVLFGNQKVNKSIINNTFIILLILFSSLIVIYSGARQAIGALIIILVLYIVLKKKSFINNMGSLILVLTIIIFLVFLFKNHEKYEYIDSIYKNSSYFDKLNRGIVINDAISSIKKNPSLGSGLGGFSGYLPAGERYYAHNIILEILTEMGIIGLIIISIWCFEALNKGRVFWKDKTKIGSQAFPFFIIILIRSLISSDLIQNIQLFTFLISWSTYNQLKDSIKSIPVEKFKVIKSQKYIIK